MFNFMNSYSLTEGPLNQTRPIALSTWTSSNQFNNLRSNLSHASQDLWDELDHYLGSEPEPIEDGHIIAWWIDWQGTYMHQSHMAINYLSIPGILLFHPHHWDLTSNLFHSATSVRQMHVQQRENSALPCLKQAVHAVDLSIAVPQNMESDGVRVAEVQSWIMVQNLN